MSAGVPISQLPAASGVNSADVVPGVQSGATKKFSFATILDWLRSNTTAANIGAIPTSEKGAASGVAELDSNGTVPAAQLPAMPSPSSATPQDLGTAAAGSSTDYSRADHVHTMPTASDVGAYVKPSGGIPASDLASGVIPTVPAISTATPQMDGTAAAGSSGEVSDAGHTHPRDTTKANETELAYVESGSTASRAYAAGECFCWGGTLYRAKTAISSGATFTVGTNVENTDVATQLGGKQPLITANGVLVSDGGGGITAKAVDNTPTASSTNLVTSGGVKSALESILSTTIPTASVFPYTPTKNGLMWVLFATASTQTSGGYYLIRDTTSSMFVWSGYTPKESSYAVGWFYAIKNHEYNIYTMSDTYASVYCRFFPFSQ